MMMFSLSSVGGFKSAEGGSERLFYLIITFLCDLFA